MAPLAFNFSTVKNLVQLAVKHGYEGAQKGETLDKLINETEYWFNDARKVAKDQTKRQPS